MKISLCCMALSSDHEWSSITGLSFCFMAWHMCEMFLTHAGVSDPVSYSGDLDKNGQMCGRVQQQLSVWGKRVQRCCLGFWRTWTAGTKLAQPCWFIGDVEMRGERNYLPGLCCESDHKEAEDQSDVTKRRLKYLAHLKVLRMNHNKLGRLDPSDLL